MTLKLYVVRHGQTCANVKGVLQGHQDSPLTALGVQSSASTGIALKDVTFNEIFCSDLGRAKDTLHQLGYKSATGFDKRLRERDYGPWSGKPWAEYKLANKSNNCDLLGVESDEKLLLRWTDFITETIKNYSGPTKEGNILLVSHGGMIRVITKHLLLFSPRPLGLNLNKCCISNNSISLFDLELDDSTILNCDVIKAFDCKHLSNRFTQ